MMKLSAMCSIKRTDPANSSSNNATFDINDESERLHILIVDESCHDNTVIKEWSEVYAGDRTGNNLSRKRRIEKVPSLMRRAHEGDNQEYNPRVVSLGPYHHGKQELQLAENLKHSILPKFISGSGKQFDDFYNKVLEVIDDVRSCYVEGSTSDYNDQEFAKMMLLDGCFLLYYIECMSNRRLEIWEFVHHMGMFAAKYILSDLFLLENQLPLQLLEALMSERFKEDERGGMIENFFAVMFAKAPPPRSKHSISRREDEKQPLHLLEALRTILLSNYDEDKQRIQSSLFPSGRKELPICDVKEYIRSSIRPVTELQAKGIQFKRSNSVSLKDIKFNSKCFYGQLSLPPRIINAQTKTIYSNLIAYEMCPSTPNDCGITSYISFMKSLICQPEDVRELRSKNILINCLGNDEEVVKMFKDIITYDLQKFGIYDQVRKDIQNHYNNKMKTWMAELIHKYFSSPWTVVAFFAATSLLILSFLQSYFTISPTHH
ncbi:unnamed protein product [Ilex paraguariensis]|uniref:Uncharacterized protein n=1 Tax=Ilex paraguariensis TaxID=185542 RepID=A0ABC8SPG3_9AQUA